MRRPLMFALVIATLLLAGCAVHPVAPASAPASAPAPPRKPAALLVVVSHPHLTDDGRYIEFTTPVLRVGLDGSVTTLPIDPSGRSPIRPDRDGRRILYSAETNDPLVRELRVYDTERGSDLLLLRGAPLAYGWDGTATIVLTGRFAAGYGVPPSYPGGVNIEVSDPVLTTGAPGSLTTHAIEATRVLNADLGYIGSRGDTRYFATEGGRLLALAGSTGEVSQVTTWPIVEYRPFTANERPRPRARLALSGIPPEDCASVGLPLLFSQPTTTGADLWFDVRRISDGKDVRTIPFPGNDLGMGQVLAPDLTRFVWSVSKRVAGRRDYRVLQEVGPKGLMTSVATATADQTLLEPLAYVGTSYDIAYSAMLPGGDRDLYLLERTSGVARRFAHLTSSQLVGTRRPKNMGPEPPRFLGWQYER